MKSNSVYKHFLLFMSMFIVKILICTYFSFQGQSTLGYLVIPQIAGDTFSYYDSIENFISKGIYEPFYRMPGVALPYYIFRHIFSIKISYILVVYFQILLDAIASYLLAYTLAKIVDVKFVFILVLLTLSVSIYASLYDIWLASDSLAMSFLVITVCLFYHSIAKAINYKLVFIAGFFMTWCVFCRPIYIVVFFLFGLFYLVYVYVKKYSLTVLFKIISLFFLVFIISDSIWIYAGYQYTNTIIPLEHNRYFLQNPNSHLEAYDYPKWKVSLVEFVQAFGGDIVDWNPDAEIYWFNTNKNIKIKSKIEKLPQRVYTSYYNQDSLLEVKSLLDIIIRDPNRQYNKDSIETIVVGKLQRYLDSYKSEKPIMYYLVSRFIIFKKLIIHNPTYNLYQTPFSNLKWYEKAIKLFYFLQYYICFLGFFIIMFFVLLMRRLNVLIPIILIALYGILIFPLLKLCEYRYLVPIMPFVIALSVFPFLFVYLRLFYGKDTLFRFKPTTPADKS